MSPTQKQFWLYFLKGGLQSKEESIGGPRPQQVCLITKLVFPVPLLANSARTMKVTDWGHQQLNQYTKKKRVCCDFPAISYFLGFHHASTIPPNRIFSRIIGFPQPSANQPDSFGDKHSPDRFPPLLPKPFGLTTWRSIIPRFLHPQPICVSSKLLHRDRAQGLFSGRSHLIQPNQCIHELLH